MACKGCQKATLREDYQDGSVVCTSCGLVNENILLDDRPLIDTRRNLAYDSGYEEMDACKDPLLMYLHHSFSVPASVLMSAFQTYQNMVRHQIIKGERRKALMAACVYWWMLREQKGGRLYTLEDVAHVLDVSLSKVHEMWKMLEPVDHDRMIRASRYHRLTPLLPSHVPIYKVVQACETLEVRVSRHKAFVDKKPGKMLAAIFHTVCCPRFVPTLDTKALLEYAGISLTTFKRHVRLLRQEASFL